MSLRVLVIGAVAAAGVAAAIYFLRSAPLPTAQDMYRQSLVEHLNRDNGVVVTMAEVKAKNYIVLHGRVYDVSSYLMNHPGGAELLTDQYGKDATEEFDVTMHSVPALLDMKDLFVGMLAA